MQDIIKKIEKQISENKLIIYIKGTPENPLCGFSAQVIHILNILNLEYVYINVLENEDIRKMLPLYSNWPTFPQVFYKNKLIGGADIITELYKNKKLELILKQ
ncbi:MAG TPA: Grx4 family monothiol glutaredoxin [Candidatus Azoamicus sp. MARI]